MFSFLVDVHLFTAKEKPPDSEERGGFGHANDILKVKGTRITGPHGR